MGQRVGLHIVYNIIRQRLGGTIEVHSEWAKAAFIITMPCTAPEIPTRRVSDEPARITTTTGCWRTTRQIRSQQTQYKRPWKILIVDDEPDVHSATALAIRNIRYKERGLELISAYSAAEANRCCTCTTISR
jgi:nitrogen-specific signal transduction histidine kinase